MGVGNTGNLVRLYSRRLYEKGVIVSGSEKERADTYLHLARGWEDRLVEQKLELRSSNADEFNNGASARWEKAGDHATDNSKKTLCYERALHFARSLPEEDRKVKELRMELKMRREMRPMPAVVENGTVVDIDIYRKEKHSRQQQAGKALRT